MWQPSDTQTAARSQGDDAILSAVLTVFTEAEVAAMSTSMLLSMVRFLDRRLSRPGVGPTTQEMRELRELLIDQFSVPTRRERNRRT